MEERQTNYTIAEGYELPSKGLIYSVPVDSHVELRSMTARDEMKRLAPSSTPYKTLADIIEGCMIEKPKVHVYDMAIGDYEFLLHRLRVVTYGEMYKLVLSCPDCGEVFESELNLDTLEVLEFDKTKFESFREFELPKSKHRVSIKFQTPHMLDAIDSKVKDYKRMRKDDTVDYNLLAVLTMVIDTVDGNKLDSLELESFINKLPALDAVKIVKNLDALNACIGINNDFTVTCSKCGADVRSFFRFGSEFFRPTNI